MIRDKPFPHDCFHLLACVNESFFITPSTCNKLIPPNSSIINEFNYNYLVLPCIRMNINGNQIQILPFFPNLNKYLDHSFPDILEF